jgi:aminomethyltransferase
MPVDCAVEGVAMYVKNVSGDIACKAHSMPFYDPQKKIRSAKG